MDSAIQPASFELQIKRQWLRARLCHDFILQGLSYGGSRSRSRGGGDLRQSPARVRQRKRRRAQRSGDGLKSRQCLVSPGGDTSDLLKQIKRSANIFQPFRWGATTSADSERLTPEYKHRTYTTLSNTMNHRRSGKHHGSKTGHRLNLHATTQANDNSVSIHRRALFMTLACIPDTFTNAIVL